MLCRLQQVRPELLDLLPDRQRLVRFLGRGVRRQPKCGHLGRPLLAPLILIRLGPGQILPTLLDLLAAGGQRTLELYRSRPTLVRRIQRDRHPFSQDRRRKLLGAVEPKFGGRANEMVPDLMVLGCRFLFGRPR